MSGKTDYLGREMACDSHNVDRLLARLTHEFKHHPVTDVVAAIETILADLVFSVAKSRTDAHVGIDRIADDMKKYLNARYAQRPTTDQVGTA
jgi:hypothetical protein